MHSDILFETNRFNLSKVKDHFINPCCFGEDLAAWLRAELQQRGIAATEPGQEDWGWCLEAKHEGVGYFIGIGGNPDDSAVDPNQGEWRIMVRRHRTVWDRLMGKNRQTQDAPLLGLVGRLLEDQPGIKNVHRE